tara:strand:+ start:2617 stop:3360 length:744 start_codon:yes stop_codon:yes gene_type:complete
MFILLFFLSAFAEEPLISADATIVVEAHRNFEVYVADVVFKNEAPEIEAVIGDHSIFRYASAHSKLAKIQSGPSSYEPLTLRHEDFKVYDKNTIEYVWENCNYVRNSKKCTFQNNHYLLETYITIDVNQLIVEMLLYDSNLQVVASGSRTSNLKVNWIKQQSSTVTVNESGLVPQQQVGQQICPPGSTNCQPVPGFNQTLGNYRSDLTTSVPKEEMPLRWEIPHKLLDSHLRQASLGLWTGVKINLD